MTGTNLAALCTLLGLAATGCRTVATTDEPRAQRSPPSAPNIPEEGQRSFGLPGDSEELDTFVRGLLVLREAPTAELLREHSFSLGPSGLGLPLGPGQPFGADIESGQYLRGDDAFRSAIKIDDHFVATWRPDERFRLEAGYFLTYLSADGPTQSYLRQGPWGGFGVGF